MRAGFSPSFAGTLVGLRFSILVPEIASLVGLVAMLWDGLGKRVLCPMPTVVNGRCFSALGFFSATVFFSLSSAYFSEVGFFSASFPLKSRLRGGFELG